MEQITINKIIKSISEFSAWMLARTLSLENGDGIISEDFLEDESQIIPQYLASNITSEKLFHPLFEITFLTQMGHILVCDRIDSIIDSVENKLFATSHYHLDIRNDNSVSIAYLSNACTEICKILNWKDEWADLRKFLLKYPDACRYNTV